MTSAASIQGYHLSLLLSVRGDRLANISRFEEVRPAWIL